MVAKELDVRPSKDKRQAAGQRAEAQLAFYLKRAFSERSELIVLNDLRLSDKGDVAQLDHLVLHPYGIVVIESKSIGTAVKINAHGEWLRVYQNRYQGMPSPKLQVERQVHFLRHFLATEAGPMLGQGKDAALFQSLPIDTLVAISDKAVIHRETTEPLDYLVKAEQVPVKLEALMRLRTPAKSWFGLGRVNAGLSEVDLTTLAKFLQQRHTLLEAPPPEPRLESRAPKPTSTHACKHCQSDALEIRWGKHSYYFKCLKCEGNTAIREPCRTCQENLRLRKDGKQFLAECGTCKTSLVFFLNP